MELTVQNMYGLLLRSRLMPLDEARGMFTRWQEEAKDGSTNLAQFAAWMVKNRYLTEYQAYLLARGHADGFFLNEYKIIERLGQGRMAGVYKAQHRLGQIVAIKVLPPSKARDANLLARFQREARLAVRLKHPNIVRTFQVGKAGALNYLVMEYLEGEPLDEVMARRKIFPPAEAVRLIFQALQGLQHIHAQGLVHRDLKPANLMLVPSPKPPANSTLQCTLKILDIGLGRALFTEDVEEDSSLDPSLTGEGVLLGTPDYMAPEQARDARAIDVRADIYSLGCVLYHLLAGQPPFPDSNIISQMIRHATEAATPLNKFNPAVPDGLQQIVNWMMTKEPSNRYPTPERAAQALQVFLASGNDTLSAPENDPKMRSYLTWLEVEDKTPAAATPSLGNKPVSNTPAAAISTPSPLLGPLSKPEKVAPRSPAHEKRRLKKMRRKAAAAGGASPAADTSSLSTVDVELMPAPLGGGMANQFSFSQMSRRDFALFGMGACAGAVAMFLGCLVALFTRRTPPPPSPPVEEGKGSE